MVSPREIPLGRRARLRDILHGRARLIGARTEVGRKDLELVHGMISPYEVRAATGLRYGDPPIEEARYERLRTRRRDAGVLVRFVLVHLMPRCAKKADSEPPPRRTRIVSAEVDARDTAEVVQGIADWLVEGRAGRVFFVHPHALNLASRDEQLRHDLAQADLVLPDGIGIRLAGRILGLDLPANVNGTDLTPELLLELAVRDLPIALIGGKPGVAERAAKEWERTTSVRVFGAWDGYRDDADYTDILDDIEARGPCLVLVAFGSPLQERFVARHFAQRRGLVTITVGGLFDFAAGDMPRAPLGWRELGLEWAWRLAHEPRRLARRYLVGNPEFLARAVWQRVSS